MSNETITNHKGTYESSSENLQLEESVKNEINSLTSDIFYKEQDGKIIYEMDTVKNFLTQLSQKDWGEVKQQGKAWALAVQIGLESIGINVGVIDGKQGKQKTNTLTRNAIKKFQRTYGLKVDGDAGPQTITKLLQVMNGDTAIINIGDRLQEFPSITNIKINGFQQVYKTKIESREWIGDEAFREEFNTGEHTVPEAYSSSKTAIRDKIKGIYDKWNNQGDIHVVFWGGTDVEGTSDMYRNEDYENKKNLIMGMLSSSNIPNKGDLMAYINNHEFYSTGRSFTSKWLVGCRNLEAIKVTIEEYKKKFGTSKNITPKLYFDYKGDMDKAGDNKTQQQRFVAGVAYIDTKGNGGIDIVKGNADRIKEEFSDVIHDEIRDTKPDKYWNDERMGDKTNCEINDKKTTVTIDTRGDVEYCDCGDGSKNNTCEYNRTTGELWIIAGGHKIQRPRNMGKLSLVGGIPESGNGNNREIIRRISLISNLMNRLKKDCFDNKRSISSTRGDHQIEYDKDGWDSITVTEEALNKLRNHHKIQIETYEIVGMIDALLVKTNVFTDQQMLNELYNKDETEYKSCLKRTT